MARLAGLEPATLGLEGRCSIQMSYGRSGAPILTAFSRDDDINPWLIRRVLLHTPPICQRIFPLLAQKLANKGTPETPVLGTDAPGNSKVRFYRIQSHKSGHRIKSGRGGEIRTPDPLLPKQLRYQAALHPDSCLSARRGIIRRSKMCVK